MRKIYIEYGGESHTAPEWSVILGYYPTYLQCYKCKFNLSYDTALKELIERKEYRKETGKMMKRESKRPKGNAYDSELRTDPPEAIKLCLNCRFARCHGECDALKEVMRGERKSG